MTTAVVLIEPVASVRVVATDDADDLGVRFAAGDPEAVRQVYRTYGRLVYAVAYKVLGDSALAEEATQRTFIQAWRAAERFDPSRPFEAWLATIARRAAIDVHRQESRHRSEDEPDQADLLVMPPSADQLSDVWDVRRALEELPEDDRELIRLHHFRQFTHAEIAVELNIPLGTVKSRTHRVHRRLADLLAHLRPARADDEGGSA